MVLALVSILIFILSFLFGYEKPRSAIWFVAYTYPLLYPVNFPIIVSDIFYLNITRVALAIILGVHLKRGKTLQISTLFKSNFIRIYLLFTVYIIVISLGDMAKYIIFTYIPEVYISITLGYFLIQTEKDYQKLIGILSWQGLIFGVIVFLDYFEIANIQLYISKMIPRFNIDNFNIDDTRAGIRRVSGIDGNAINSSVRLVILFPISLLYLKLKNSKIKYIIPVTLVFSIIVLLSRAAYISLALAIVFLVFSFANEEKNISKKFVAIIKTAIIFSSGLLLLLVFPFTSHVLQSIYSFSFETSTLKNIDQRILVFPQVIEMIINSPFIGNICSPFYVYNDIMGGHDLPLPIIYLLAGGIPLVVIFIIWGIMMPFYFMKFISKANRSKEELFIIIMVSASFVGGLIPMLSNWIDTSTSLMIIIFSATYKFFLLKRPL
ncbi:MAG: hypothetical protein A2W90_16590 [Bacteroidetes bacterium GWF2_42_66]|nr:MAG: hypothetical protein A2W92_04025 [Bacteroidetes bacterium GWA2_42_15]OFX96312.1 MAG: hypothetical protein A2W89_05520 [Bacteroidetes bacterium GWE2_42_39]OFY46351.1 MAG: hypothetical protein A2W90_16590 [Bacteroidetes bacterium GWF2_42_66]HAZ03473.1 hypothetical protein [Marinilabiliales bacterium]HBL78263.1 hypothetical protein [Prolixibacteraceae bacterium]